MRILFEQGTPAPSRDDLTGRSGEIVYEASGTEAAEAGTT